ncbi:hypothetical protein BCR34DRAFT_565945 [Clohesyomyces aquaticus]|uniref:Uncharacterized protein n=1 Tax=Clohesyomyces aquaticus TaxID=1231657 RepID=A0A1Y1ZKY0_9PLEO|nr:hypothetical protein BCR34DRAFT_565945 [Clohesyomyces aquaticus]
MSQGLGQLVAASTLPIVFLTPSSNLIAATPLYTWVLMESSTTEGLWPTSAAPDDRTLGRTSPRALPHFLGSFYYPRPSHH